VWVGYEDVALGFDSLGPEGWLAGVRGPRISGAIRSLAVTADGSIWFGSSAGGAARYDPAAWPAGPDRALGPWEVRAIFQAADGLLWFATAGDGVYRYDGVRWTRYSADPALSSAPVQSLALDPSGTAWLGTAAGVVRLEETACQADSRVARVNALAATAAADGVWFATPANGALRWNLDGNSVWRAANWTGTNVTALASAPDGAIWFFGDKGLARLLAREWQVLPPDAGLFPDGALSLAVAPDGDVWAGTPHGVRHYDGREWRALTPRDGLADDVVHFVLAAPDGALWFATPGGLSRYRP
jgi:ligand-binding sensor domain-containing protein